MAVKAKASITISHLIDILSVTRYYLLQSSTSAAPAKPTTNPPTDWTVTEPSYTSGSTNTLYFVDCTMFTNDTFKYSEVSKSSSYEAAKEAYNKAAAVETRVTNAETQIEQNKEAITLRATKTEVTDQIDEASNDLQTILDDKNKEILDSCSESIDKALENYVRTGDYTEYKETVTTQLELLSNQIEMNFTTTTESINSTNSTMRNKFNEWSKYIRFDTNGIEIGSTENALKLILDNERIRFMKDDAEVAFWDGNYLHTGNIMVDTTERAQFGNFAFVPRSDGSLMFLKVKN